MLVLEARGSSYIRCDGRGDAHTPSRRQTRSESATAVQIAVRRRCCHREPKSRRLRWEFHLVRARHPAGLGFLCSRTRRPAPRSGHVSAMRKDMSDVLPKARTGVAGLDEVIGGGLAVNRLHLLEGTPGTGKTTIALQFLLAGAAADEAGIYISLAETEHELRDGARSHGWTISPRIEVFELVPPESVLDPDQHQSLLYSSDLELGETIKRILEAFERVRPSRVVIDSLSEIRLLAQSSLRYRRQILALKHYFVRHGATVLMLDDCTSDVSDKTADSVVHGVIQLEELAPDYGAERRRLRVSKYRGQAF